MFFFVFVKLNDFHGRVIETNSLVKCLLGNLTIARRAYVCHPLVQYIYDENTLLINEKLEMNLKHKSSFLIFDVFNSLSLTNLLI